jgi:hypothetical protein
LHSRSLPGNSESLAKIALRGMIREICVGNGARQP